MIRTLDFAARRLVRARVFTITSVLTLMLGIGAAAAVFTVVNGVLLRPMPYDHAEQLVDLTHSITLTGISHIDQSDATYLVYRHDNHVFTDVGAYRSEAVNLAAQPGSESGDASAPERVSAALTTASTFRVLDVTPKLGRGLAESDDQLGAAPVVMIGQRLWEQKFAADPSIIGHRVVIDGSEREVVGVMAATFRFPTSETTLWLPLQIDPAHTASAAFDYGAIARLRPGISIGAAAKDLQQLLRRVPQEYPGRLTAGGITGIHMQAVVRPLRDVVVGDVGRVLWIVLGAVATLLLIASANVANLFLARAEGRQRELAVRCALGAGRAALLAEFLSETVILSTIGGGLGLLGAIAGIRAVQSIGAAASIPRLAEVHVDAVVLAVMAGTVALTAIIIGLVPALRSRTASLSGMLMASGQATTGGRARHRARRALVMAQVALALVLLASAGLLARSFARLRSVDPGFVGEHALTFRLALPSVVYPGSADAARGIVRILDAVRAVPGVSAVGVTTRLPLEEATHHDSAVFVEDHPRPAGAMPGIHEIVFVTPGYFEAMGIRLVAGRVFSQPDAGGEPTPGVSEVVVNEAFAQQYWAPGQAIGKLVRMNPNDPWSTIVGVVGSVRDVALDRPPSAVVYRPLVSMNAGGKPWTPRDVAFVVRTSSDPASLAATVRRVVGAEDPTLPLYHVMSVGTLLSEAAARMTFVLIVLAAAAVMAMTIGAVGIYGVIAYLVSLRTREIGIRLALGAKPADVRRLVARQTVADAAIGVGVGLLGAVLSTRVLATVLFEVSPLDPAALGGASVLLLLTAIAASWLPARRAAALNPVSALRSD